VKVAVFTYLLVILVACTAAPQTTPVPPRTPELTPANLSTSAAASVEPSTASALASGVLLFVRRPEAHTSYFPQPPSAQRYRSEVHLVDPETGQDVAGYTPLDASSAFMSADGKRLAAIESHGQACESFQGGQACWDRADVLHLVDLQDRREVTTTVAANGWLNPMTFSPGGERLALSYQERRSSTLLLLDARSGALVARSALPVRPSLLRYTADGKSLAIYGQPLSSDPGVTQPDAPHVLFLDAATLDMQWDQPLTGIISGSWCLENCGASHEQQLSGVWTPAVAASRDGRKLYVVQAGAERLTTVDFDARTVRTVEIRPTQSWLERLLDLTAGVAEAKGSFQGAHRSAALAADGAKLYVLTQTSQATRTAQGDWDTQYTSLGLQVIEVASGHQVARRESTAKAVTLTPDGTHLLLADWDGLQWWTDVIDAGSLQSVMRLDNWEIVPSDRTDGQSILLAQDPYHQPTRLAVLDPQTFAVTHSWSADGSAEWITTP
jgi:hypothetical protein